MFAVTQTVGYCVLYYAFSVLITAIAADLHTDTAHVSAALTISVLVAAATAIPVGRWLDRRCGRTLMTAGSTLGVVAVAAWSQVNTVGQLYAVFLLIGLASAMSLYEADRRRPVRHRSLREHRRRSQPADHAGQGLCAAGCRPSAVSGRSVKALSSPIDNCKAIEAGTYMAVAAIPTAVTFLAVQRRT